MEMSEEEKQKALFELEKQYNRELFEIERRCAASKNDLHQRHKQEMEHIEADETPIQPCPFCGKESSQWNIAAVIGLTTMRRERAPCITKVCPRCGHLKIK
jgi:hypothetical protein